ncbi:Dabb family protein [Robiginitalea sp. IMCC44478]|uniref:Dabb family protein n=1 Tax=Robiginitalea sp. IMCC44478 TaxID=3459122 RepID=UPI004042010F
MKRLFTTILLVFLMVAAQGLTAQENKALLEFNPAFSHTVYFWLHHPDKPDDRARFEKALWDFLSESRYARTRFIGTPPKASREVVDDSFTYALILSFESAEDQEAYQQEEVHLKFIKEAGPLWKKVVVYDATGLEKSPE